uniref:Uncharacterized protein n=1 Tax=Tanacetum cinerariifolium TaxID=118510 RepID=A0A699I459_TANCI|nr:hypothetical protein [Tanacetum cinerariifolium]
MSYLVPMLDHVLPANNAPGKKTKSDTSTSTGGSSSSSQWEIMTQELRLKREAAKKAFKVAKGLTHEYRIGYSIQRVVPPFLQVPSNAWLEVIMAIGVVVVTTWVARGVGGMVVGGDGEVVVGWETKPDTGQNHREIIR